jgi:hypothetical protein
MKRMQNISMASEMLAASSVVRIASPVKSHTTSPKSIGLDVWLGATIVPELVLASHVSHRKCSNNSIQGHAMAATRHSGGPIAMTTISAPISVQTPKSV